MTTLKRKRPAPEPVAVRRGPPFWTSEQEAALTASDPVARLAARRGLTVAQFRRRHGAVDPGP